MKMDKKISSSLLIVILLSFFIHPPYETSFTPIVQGEGIASAWYNNSSINVYVIHRAPRINWYDFQYNNSGTWISKLNQKIEVDNHSEYRFIVNISSDQGWIDIEFINITAWFDHGTESTSYNQTLGGNINLFIQYENTTVTSNNPVFRYLWPYEEVRFNSAQEQMVNDTLYGFEGLTEARNMTFPFIPNKQFRYAPGDNSTWDDTITQVGNSSYYGLYNNYSWNFNITVDDSEGYTSWVSDEFGVYRYSEIISAQNPYIRGFPDNNFSVNDAGGSGNISILTSSNGNFNLSVHISDLAHTHLPLVNISRTHVYVRGGNRTSFRSLVQPVYLYGGSQDGMTDYYQASANGTIVNTSNVEYKCYIPFGQLAGHYSSSISYYLSTEE